MPSQTARMLRLTHIVNSCYRQDLDVVFATTLRLTRAKPEQANNEIRNGLNHLARALTETRKEDADTQFRKAVDHFDRAKRDCLKIALVQLHGDLWKEITDIEIVEGCIDSDLRGKVRRWEDGRLSVTRAECRGEADIGAQLMRLVNDGIDLKKSILDRHRTPAFWKVWLYRRRPWVRALVKEAVAILFFAVLASAILQAYHRVERMVAFRSAAPVQTQSLPSEH